MPDNTHVVGQMRGYLLQIRHMLYELISIEDITVSVEQLDDVAVEKDDGTIIAEQLKSVISADNPVANRSTVFWKTLYNWYNYVKNGDLSISKTIFKMIVIANRDISVGNISEQIFNAKTYDEAKEALKQAKLALWGKNEELKAKIPDSYADYLEVLFSPANEDVVTKLISKVEPYIYEDNYDEQLTARFYKQILPSKFKDNLLIYMLGWVDETANCYTKQGLPPIITSKEYRDALEAQCRMYYEKDVIPQLTPKIPHDQAVKEVEKADTYIKQLDLIEESFEEKLYAASDYLQAKSENTERSKKGLITKQIMDGYQDKVCRLWRNKRKQVLFSQQCGDSDILKGQALYTEMSTCVLLLDNSYPDFWGAGILHSLANLPHDNPQIGWHPKYEELLNEVNDDE